MKRSTRHAGRPLARTLAALSGAALIAAAIPASAAVTATDWPAYLDGPMHSSYNAAETTITPANAPALVQKWHDASGHKYLSSPTVADGAVFIGANSGWFYKFDQTTGATLHKVFIRPQSTKTCDGVGFADTATVAVDPQDHQDTVYVGAANGYLYAFRASNLSLKWRSVIAIPSTRISDYFEWSSPTIANGKIYIGVSSNCDRPLIRGAVIGYTQATGKKFAEFHTVRKGAIGGSVWSSVAVDPGGDVYATTGNGPATAPRLDYSESIVKLAPGTLKPLGHFKVPASQMKRDGDFGASPTIFGPYVGACNKNGIFYAVKRSTMTLAWDRQLGAKSAFCIAAAVYDSTHLYLGGTATTINGTAYKGSVQARDPATGTLLWKTGLPNGVYGSPTMNGGGVIAAGTYGNATTPDAIYLIDAATGTIVGTHFNGSHDFAQTVFADGWLFTANGNGVHAYGP